VLRLVVAAEDGRTGFLEHVDDTATSFHMGYCDLHHRLFVAASLDAEQEGNI